MATSASDTLFGSLNRPDNLADEIAQQIRQKILSQAFEPGQRLPTEFELAQRFGVSRNVVREAIARLKLSGYVETRRGVGSFVAAGGQANFEILPEDLLRAEALEQIYQLRVEIEAGAAALAAEHRSEAQLEALRAALARVDAAREDWRQGPTGRWISIWRSARPATTRISSGCCPCSAGPSAMRCARCAMAARAPSASPRSNRNTTGFSMLSPRAIAKAPARRCASI